MTSSAPARKTASRAVRQPQDRKPKTEPAAKTETLAAFDGWVDVDLDGETLHVKPIAEWRQSAQTALREGRFNDWALAVLDEDSAEIWRRVDPTNAQVWAFMEDYHVAHEAAAGVDPTRSSSSTRGSTTTPRRSR
jgi:hypothetical protein